MGLGANYKLTAGDLAIDYPIEIDLRVPGAYSPGEWATIRSALDVLPGARIKTQTPDGHIDLNGVFGFSASAGAKACVVTCGESTTPVTIPTSSGRIFRIDNESVHDFTAYQLEQLGLSGSVQLPDLSVGTTTRNSNGSLSASGSGEYAKIGISAIEWGFKLAGIELAFNFNLPTCCGTSAGYTTFDSSFNVKAEAGQALKFKPKVKMVLAFPQALDYEVHREGGGQKNGHGKKVSFFVGDKVRIRIPGDQNGALKIDPKARIARPLLRNRTTSDVRFGGDVEALKANATVPSYPPVWPGFSYTLGPVYEEEYPIADLPRIDVWTDKWPVAGFKAKGLKPFALTPR